LLTHQQVMELSPINAAAAHQDSGLAVRRAQSQYRSRNQGERQEVNNYQFRPSQQQRGLNLFHMEPNSALDQARTLAEGLAATVPKTDPPRPGMKEMELTLVQRVNEATFNSKDWKHIRNHLEALEKLNKFYQTQSMKYISEVYPVGQSTLRSLM